MKREELKYISYVQILKEELVPAMGCTEPIALAYGAAKAREVLGCMPDRVVIGASGSIIKNVKSVIVPNTDHLKGIPAAATAGIVAGKAEKELECIAVVSKEEIAAMREFLANVPITVEHVDTGVTFEIVVTVYSGESYAKVRIVNYHTNIVLIEKDGEVLHSVEVAGEDESGLTDRTLLNIKDILDFANTVELDDEGLSPIYIKMLRVAKECGCKFHFGSDAHEPSMFIGSHAKLERAAERAGITRDDLWEIVK